MRRAALAIVLVSLVSVQARAGPEIDTASNKITRNAADQAGSTVAFTSSQLNGALGEGSGPGVSFTSSKLYPGLMGIESFPGLVSNLSAAVVSSVSINLSWNAPGVDGALGVLPSGSAYHIQSASATPVSWAYSNAQISISTSGVNPGDAQASLAQGLESNTTYFFGLWTQDAQGDISVLSNGATVATLAQPPGAASPAFAMVGVDSVTAQWTPLPATPSSSTGEGYELDASTAADFTGTVLSSATPNAALGTLTVAGLFSNTTYYFRAGSLNWAGLPDFATLGSTLTQASPDTTPPSDVADLAASTRTATSALLTWTAPSDPDNNPLDGTYAIQYATWTGVSWSTTAAQIRFSTSGVLPGQAQGYVATGLDSNTTHYFRVWTADGKPNWSALSNGATVDILAGPISNAGFVSIATGSVALAWQPFPVSPSSDTSEGYEFDASTAADFTGTIFSSVTTAVAASTLIVSGLDPNTTYFFRVGSLNWTQTPNYAFAGAFATLSVAPTRLAYDFFGVYPTSAAARWAALPGTPSSSTSEGYELDASSTNFGALSPGGLIYSSATIVVAASTLTVSGLDPNTTYYFRVGSLNWNDAADEMVLSATSTLAQPPALLSPVYAAADNVSATAQWGAAGNSAGTPYELDLSTASDFTGTIFSSTTLNVSAVAAGLAPDTTYYGRVFATNNDGIPTAFLLLGDTATLSSIPIAVSPSFTPVFFTSLTVNFADGSPANPSDALYDVQLSSFSNFSAFYDSVTANLDAGFTGLSPNTTYYAQAASINRSGIETAFTALASTATLAVAPGPVVTTFTNITANGFTMSWSSGTGTTGYNPDGTTYIAEVSTASDFSGTLVQSIVTSTTTDFSGLLSGTLYYGQVQAVNYQGVASTFTSYGSATTLPSAAPTFLAGSFLVGDSLGNFISPALYTDTTTPTLQVQVQSNFAPGLSVTDTPSQLALWHLDEGAGAVSADSARHGYTLTLQGAPKPSWISGELGGALLFDGTQNFAVSPDVSATGWRKTAANNQWSVALWFNTGLAKGFLFQVANSNAAGAGTYDGELSLYKSTGKLAFEITNSGGTRNYEQASTAYNNNSWHFAVGVLNTTGFYLYVDGSQVASNTAVTSANARTYAGPTYLWTGAASTLGANMGGSAGVRFYPDSLDEVLVTTVALTGAQISQLYGLVSAQTHAFGAPSVDLSTSAGTNNSWTRLSTNTFALTGADGDLTADVWTSTLALQAPLLIQTASPGASTDQVMFLEDALDSQLTTAQFTVLVDTTPPPAPTYASLSAPTTFGLAVTGLSGSDALSGLNALPFLLQASTDPAFSVVNANSGWIAGLTFTFTTLLPNTTYFVRAQVRDAAGSQGNKSAFSFAQTLATLAVAPSTAALEFLAVQTGSVTVAWVALPQSPPDASSKTCEGYVLQASSNNFGALSPTGAPVFSSTTYNVLASTLSLGSSGTPLDLSNTYYFQVASLNWAGQPNYTTLTRLNFQIQQSTNHLSFGIMDPFVARSTVSTSSMVVTNVGNWPVTIALTASTATLPSSPWTLSTSSGIDTIALLGVWYTGALGPPAVGPPATAFNTYLTTTTTISQASGNYSSASQNGYQLAPGANITLWVEFFMPTSTTSNGHERIQVAAQPGYP